MSEEAQTGLAAFRAHIKEALWEPDLSTRPWWQLVLFTALRFVFVVLRDISEGQLTLRAMSLVYTTLLSLVPLLAISFSVLKGFGVHNQIEPFLMGVLAPLGERAEEITQQVIEFVDNMQVGVLGFLGLALLFYTVVSLMQKIERAINHAWRITKRRSLALRFRDYLSILLVGPVLIFAALGISASVFAAPVVQSLAAIEPLGTVVELTRRLVPYVLVIAAFTFIYVFLPNTLVRLRAALIGGVVAGVLWNAVGWGFASFIINSTKYTAIYSTFATLVLFMIWLYVGWLILLIGADVAFYVQNPEYLSLKKRDFGLSNRVKEKLAALSIHHIARRFYEGGAPWTCQDLAHSLRVPVDAVEFILAAMVAKGFLTLTRDEPAGYILACPPEETRLIEVLRAVRRAEEDYSLTTEALPGAPAVDALLSQVGQSLETALGGLTIKDIATSEPSGGEAAVQPLAMRRSSTASPGS